MSEPGTPGTPYVISSVKTSPTAATLTLGWPALLETGGVPLTGYKLYQKRLSDSVQSLAYDGTSLPSITQATITGLILDEDYQFWVTGLNPSEGLESEAITVRAAGKPLAPGDITEVASSRTGTSIGLEWTAPTSDEGSAIISYTLVKVVEN